MGPQESHKHADKMSTVTGQGQADKVMTHEHDNRRF